MVSFVSATIIVACVVVAMILVVVIVAIVVWKVKKKRCCSDHKGVFLVQHITTTFIFDFINSIKLECHLTTITFAILMHLEHSSDFRLFIFLTWLLFSKP